MSFHLVIGPVKRPLQLIALATALLLGAQNADAGGLFMPTHGARALGRAGAFVAGGDDAGGIYYNPANLSGLKGIHLLFDSVLPIAQIKYQRIDSGNNLMPEVTSGGFPLPIPTLAFAMPLIADRFWLGVSLSAPTAALPSYPTPNYELCTDPLNPSKCLTTAHRDAPQRYSLVNFEGTLFLRLEVALAVQIVPGLTLGASFQNVFARMRFLSVVSSYNGVISGGPEDPDFDSVNELDLKDMFNPSGQFGFHWQPHDMVKIAGSVQLPVTIASEGKVTVQLPTAPFYESSSVEGNVAHIDVHFPWMVSGGVELLPVPELRLELDFVWEQWSTVDRITVDTKDIYINDLPGVGRYKIPTLYEELQFQDVFSVRFGAEYHFKKFPLVLRGGYAFERGAAVDEFLSVIAHDSNKHMISLGASFTLWGFRMDVGYAMIVVPQRSIAARTALGVCPGQPAPATQLSPDQWEGPCSMSPQINPVNPSGVVAVGGGTYKQSYHLLGGGITRTF